MDLVVFIKEQSAYGNPCLLGSIFTFPPILIYDLVSEILVGDFWILCLILSKKFNTGCLH